MRYSVIIDFDGTITTEDVAEKVLEFHANGDWLEVEQQALAGKITMNECIVGQYSMIQGDLDQIMNTARSVGKRDGIIKFLQYCKNNKIEVICVSAGLDFVIEDFLSANDLEVPLIAPKTKYRSDGTFEVFPVTYRDEFKDFKHEVVMQQKNRGHTVLYFGDGYSDLGGIVFADYRFVVKGSNLERYCIENNLKATSFSNYHEIIEHFSKNFNI